MGFSCALLVLQELWLTKGFVILLSLISTCVVMLVFR